MDNYMTNRFIPAAFLFILASLWIMSVQTANAQATDKSAATKSATETTQAVDLEQYVGAYGPRTIALTYGTLTYMRDGMPMPVAMEAAGVDTFKVVIPPGAQVRGPSGDHVIPAFVFLRNDAGEVESLSLVNPDGTVVGTAKRTKD